MLTSNLAKTQRHLPSRDFKLHQSENEPPRPKRNIPQCSKCQRYGHAQAYIYHRPRCVKYAGTHLTKQCPDIGIRAITQIFNSVLRTGYLLGQWKVSKIITILKPGKPDEEVTFYRPISLLPILSKLSEKIFLTRIKPILQETGIIPDYQFGFRQKHTAIEQVHGITNVRRWADKFFLHCNIFIYIRHIWIKPVLCSRMVSLFQHTTLNTQMLTAITQCTPKWKNFQTFGSNSVLLLNS